MKVPAPVRLLLPAMLLLFGGLVVVFSSWLYVRVEYAQAEGDAEGHARLLGVLMAGRIEQSWRRDQPELATAEVRYARADPQLREALLSSATGEILAATDASLEGKDVRATRFSDLWPVFQRVATRRRSHVALSPGRTSVVGVHAVQMAPLPGEIVPSRVALLFTEHDLALAQARARALALRQALLTGAVLAGLALVSWWLLHAMLVARMEKLVSAAARLAAGRAPVRAELEGRDELAQISRAFDDMASRLETDRRRLQESEERFRELIERGSDIIAEVDQEGRIEFLSPSIHRVLGIPPARLTGERLVDLVHPDDGACAERLLTGDPSMAGGAVLRVRDQQGTWRHLEALASRRLGGEARTILNARDITERLALEDRLRQSQKMEAVGQLAGGIAHDFNNLLTAILGYADILVTDGGLDDQARRDVAAIQQAATSAAALTQQLLAFSRRQVLHPEVVDLNAVVQRLRSMLRRLIPEDVILMTELAPEPQWVRVDATQLEQVILNLALNARDAMPQGGRLTIRTEAAGHAVEFAVAGVTRIPGAFSCLSVSDTGTGIDDDTLPHLFEPFYTTKGRTRGTGLGLATVYGIVKQSGGHIGVDTEVGVGTRLTICLPASAGQEVLPGAAAQPAPVTPAGPGETVLVAEDEDSVRGLVETVLRRCGYTVMAARDGWDALACAAAHPGRIDLLVTDVVMPGLNGRELAERLTQARPRLRVLFISGHADGALAPQRPDNAAFLPKPFNADDLARHVRELLDRHA